MIRNAEAAHKSRSSAGKSASLADKSDSLTKKRKLSPEQD